MESEMNDNVEQPFESQSQQGPGPQPEQPSTGQQNGLQQTFLNLKLSTWVKCFVISLILSVAAVFIVPEFSTAQSGTPTQPSQQEAFSSYDEYEENMYDYSQEDGWYDDYECQEDYSYDYYDDYEDSWSDEYGYESETDWEQDSWYDDYETEDSFYGYESEENWYDDYETEEEDWSYDYETEEDWSYDYDTEEDDWSYDYEDDYESEEDWSDDYEYQEDMYEYDYYYDD
ncbi:MAG: hypothetical protein GY774_29485 [Planctomycetes bacterium]|nr:hypothetical protein [Planctomycetota bacterium]